MSEITKLITSVEETTSQDFIFVQSEGDIKKIRLGNLLPYKIEIGHLIMNHGSTYSVTFETPFETIPRIIAGHSTGASPSTSKTELAGIMVGDITTAGFTIKLYSGDSGSYPVSWIAIAGESSPELISTISASLVEDGGVPTVTVDRSIEGVLALTFYNLKGADGAAGAGFTVDDQGNYIVNNLGHTVVVVADSILLNGPTTIWKGLNVAGDLTVAPGYGETGQIMCHGLDSSGEPVSSVGEPTEPDDAATKNYVDEAVAAAADAGLKVVTISGTIHPDQLRRIVELYEANEPFCLRVSTGPNTYKLYYIVEENKTAVSATLTRYYFSLASKDGFGDPAYFSNGIQTYYLSIDVELVSPGQENYTYTVATKAFSSEMTSQRRDAYNSSEFYDNNKYYSLRGTFSAIYALTKFSYYKTAAISAGGTEVFVPWHGVGQSSDHCPSAVVRVTEWWSPSPSGYMPVFEHKDFTVKYEWVNNLRWQLCVTLPAAAEHDLVVEIWSDTNFGR